MLHDFQDGTVLCFVMRAAGFIKIKYINYLQILIDRI